MAYKTSMYTVALTSELVEIAEELLGENLHGRKMEYVSDIIEEALAETLLRYALELRGEFYYKNFNALRRLRFKNDALEDVPMPKKRRRK